MKRLECYLMHYEDEYDVQDGPSFYGPFPTEKHATGYGDRWKLEIPTDGGYSFVWPVWLDANRYGLDFTPCWRHLWHEEESDAI